MWRVAWLAVLIGLSASSSYAQEPKEAFKLGVTAAAGFPAGLTAVRVGAAAGPRAGIDFAVARLGRWGDDRLGPAFITHVRWIRGGRTAAGNSGYWIFGALFSQYRSSTLVIFPGDVRRYLTEHRILAMPRVGYGWDHLTRRGTRLGVELTTGAAGEQAALMLANVFLMWGPPRR